MDGYIKVGLQYSKYDPPVCKPESKPPTKTTFSDLAPFKDRPGGIDPFYRQMAPPTQPPSTLADRALRGEPIAGAEGIKRATGSPDKIYIW